MSLLKHFQHKQGVPDPEGPLTISISPCASYILNKSVKCFCWVMYLTRNCNCICRISSINTASSISTPVWYYSNANNIEMVEIFISNAPSNSTTYYFATPDIIAKYRVTMAVSSIVFRVIMSSCKERSKCIYTQYD